MGWNSIFNPFSCSGWAGSNTWRQRVCGSMKDERGIAGEPITKAPCANFFRKWIAWSVKSVRICEKCWRGHWCRTLFCLSRSVANYDRVILKRDKCLKSRASWPQSKKSSRKKEFTVFRGFPRFFPGHFANSENWQNWNRISKLDENCGQEVRKPKTPIGLP